MAGARDEGASGRAGTRCEVRFDLKRVVLGVLGRVRRAGLRRPARAGSSGAARPSPDPSALADRRARAVGPTLAEAMRAENIVARRYRQDRVVYALLLMMAAIIAGLVAVLLMLLPLQKVVPYVYRVFPHSAQVQSLEPLAISRHTADLLTEGIVRRYVRERHEVLPVVREMYRRWQTAEGFVPAHSTPEVYRRFMAERGDRVMLRLQEQAYEVEVEVKSVLYKGDQLYHVYFATRERVVLGSDVVASEVVERHLIAFLHLKNITYDRAPTEAELLRNTLGIVIVAYSERVDDVTRE